jgi:hypothetical protein
MRRLVLAIMATLILCACQRSLKERSSPPSQTDAARLKTSPYLQLNEQQQRDLLAKVPNVKIGDTCQQVEVLLGKPELDELQYKKQPPYAFVQRLFVYYIREQDKDLVNEIRDEWVEFRFDQSNHLREIYAKNIDGIKNQP